MSVTLRQRLIQAVITGLTLGSVVGVTGGVASPAVHEADRASTFVSRPSAHILHLQHVRHVACDAASRLDAYTVVFEDGSRTEVWSGPDSIQEDSSMYACLAYLYQYAQDHAAR